MGLLTVSLDDHVESFIRALAKEKYLGKKGSIAKVIEDLAAESQEMRSRRVAFERLKSRLEKGYDMGKLRFAHRSELYDRP